MDARYDIPFFTVRVAGYRTEDSVGRAIRESGLDRSDLYLTTKWSGVTSIPEAINHSLDQVCLLSPLPLLSWPQPAVLARRQTSRPILDSQPVLREGPGTGLERVREDQGGWSR